MQPYQIPVYIITTSNSLFGAGNELVMSVEIGMDLLYRVKYHDGRGVGHIFQNS